MEDYQKVQPLHQHPHGCHNLGKLTLLALGFFMLYTAYCATANIVSLALEKNGYGPLGFLSIGFIYISWGLGSLISSTIYKRISQRWSIFLGAVSNSTWIFSSLLTLNRSDDPLNDEWYHSTAFVYCIVLANSIFNGFFNGPMWVAACKQITAYSTPETYGSYFSYFWIFYISSQIFGNTIAAYVLMHHSQRVFFVCMGTLAFVASVYLTCQPYQDDKKRALRKQRQESKESQPLL